eukprot:CAMPEP_0167782536 /NCGR_PEP_ID=MMETSP0111_2-20121227/6573_1 /TAXON_ID=91324 /ORGANISM="Lotharella globosa, Strain CCCM811" /LENGTH=136 /DNA_ID=CAMNT_0007673381 /DNA_START=819 /DNA_END=1229 /DNA_ORIENTATION=+
MERHVGFLDLLVSEYRVGRCRWHHVNSRLESLAQSLALSPGFMLGKYRGPSEFQAHSDLRVWGAVADHNGPSRAPGIVHRFERLLEPHARGIWVHRRAEDDKLSACFPVHIGCMHAPRIMMGERKCLKRQQDNHRR